MNTMIKVPITPKEAEAIVWGLGQIVNDPDRGVLSKADPLGILLNEGFDRAAIMKSGNELMEVVYTKWLTDPMTPLEKALLRVSIENSTWLEPYIEEMPSYVGEARAALRSLAGKLEAFDIYVNHIPND